MSNKTNRIKFHEELCKIIGADLEDHVYFQPPENLQMQYPAIVYSRQRINNVSSNNEVYLQGTYYQVIVIDKDPDSDIVDKVSKFPTVRHDRHFTTSGLNHDVFTIYYN